MSPRPRRANAGIDDTLIRSVRAYRQRARMTQALMAEFCGLSKETIKRLERHQPVTEETRDKVKSYLAEHQASRPLKPSPSRPPNVYLTKKLQTWARIMGISPEAVDAAKSLKDAYDRAKRDEGLASIPLIQLEVENALTLATRGAYYRARR